MVIAAAVATAIRRRGYDHVRRDDDHPPGGSDPGGVPGPAVDARACHGGQRRLCAPVASVAGSAHAGGVVGAYSIIP